MNVGRWFNASPPESPQNRICVFAAGSNGAPQYQEQAELLGELIGERGFGLVYGGFDMGLMGILARAAKRKGAEVTGVVPGEAEDEYLDRSDILQGPSLNDELKTVGTWDNRKRTMIGMADAVIALAGGIGTLDEISTTLEISRGRSSVGAASNLALINSGGYYEGLRQQLNQMRESKLIRSGADSYAYFAADATDAMDYIGSKLGGQQPERPRG